MAINAHSLAEIPELVRAKYLRRDAAYITHSENCDIHRQKLLWPSMLC